MAEAASDLAIIESMIGSYFKGLHSADTKLLDSLFDDNVSLYAPGIRRTKAQWLELVANRPVPQALGHPYRYQILSIELCGEQAFAKLSCPLLGEQYIDFLGFLHEQGQWTIVSKQYANNPFLQLKQ
ncbi:MULTISPECIES: nuclear transport factor 2 family protein [Motilimonas]|uniref:Nuclear transport factor 2 family protein n=1 Tax=Motilimonas cestriensis TaxID=2742685 RepID=A0ABS8WFG9_9GAMM|nr:MULTISPECIES: nuclear transport factor 2 family protein [Motilimonas]MCE2596433.1 nuclear transport factor 2 family protein [Motilimonas cestriensis]MDO6526716.1 nuclear transport factor 2 family protein [Motilimonas sp. 1_MG-2023]